MTAPRLSAHATLVGVGITVILAIIAGAVFTGRSLQRLDDLAALMTDTRAEVTQTNQQMQHLAQGVAAIEGALGVGRDSQHAGLLREPQP